MAAHVSPKGSSEARAPGSGGMTYRATSAEIVAVSIEGHNPQYQADTSTGR